jgi:hypothetical protein
MAVSIVFRIAVCLSLVLPMTAQDAAEDGHDLGVIDFGLSNHISADSIYESARVQQMVEKQADDIVAASQRRLARQEKRVEATKALIAEGKAEPADLKIDLDELDARIRLGHLVLDRADVLHAVVRAAREAAAKSARSKKPVMERFRGTGTLSPVDIEIISRAYLKKFGRPLPVSASGGTSLHRALGFNHAGRIDVALSPDQVEGVWLRSFLTALGIPYYAFRKAVVGSATAPHIHIGPGSTRLHDGG